MTKNLCNLLLKICEICVHSFQPLRSTKDYVRNYKLFLQNEPKFRKVKLNVTKVLTRGYEQMDTWSIRKNEPKTNPNKAKFKKAKMNVTSIITKDYENMSNWAICENEAKTNPKQTQFQGQKNAVLRLYAVGYLRKK